MYQEEHRRQQLDGGELTAAPGTPVPDLILTAGRRRGLPMSSTLERAREVDERGVKRPAEVDAGDFQRQAQADAQFEQAPALKMVEAQQGHSCKNPWK